MAGERTSDFSGRIRHESVAGRAGLCGNSNESPLEKRSGLLTRVEDGGEDGESGKEGAEDKEVVVDKGGRVLEGSGFDAGCEDDWECDETIGAGLVAGGVGMLEVTEGLPCAANARTTTS